MKPFSILDTRTKEWKDRKKYWIDTFGIKSELGREGITSKSGFWDTGNYVSVFDPTLTENLLTWFCPPNGNVLDPFAGGSVRGIVAEELGFNYTGIDISEQQIKANRKQSSKPNWIVGDSKKELFSLDTKYDFVLTCPPYHDLEKYTDNPDDLSNMEYHKFIKNLEIILYESQLKLKKNRFFAIVVSEIRELPTTRNYKIGKYKGFVSDVVKMCERHNLHFYNDMVLFNSQHQASRTMKTYFNRNRKVPSVHQNVLIFVKGNPDLATEIIEFDGTYKCIIEGTKYRSFREASITIDPSNIIPSEVERRCKSTKSKYREWQIIGEETNPDIQYEVDGIPFESPIQIAELIGGNFTESMARNYINSKNQQYRHWKRAKDWNITYDEMFDVWECDLRITLPVIKCDNRDFYSLQDAATHFGVSSERIRQKLNADKFPEFNYLY